MCPVSFAGSVLPSYLTKFTPPSLVDSPFHLVSSPPVLLALGKKRTHQEDFLLNGYVVVLYKSLNLREYPTVRCFFRYIETVEFQLVLFPHLLCKTEHSFQ